MSDLTEARGRDETGGRNAIQVIGRAAAILRTLADAQDGLSLRAIASRVGLPRSTVQRIVHALAAEGLVSGTSVSAGVTLGPEIQRLASRLSGDAPRMIRPFLTELSAMTGETIDLAVLRGDHIEFVDQVVGAQRLRAVSAVGERFPLHTTASGKACLSLLPDDDVLRLVAGSLGTQPGSDEQSASLWNEIRTARRTGLAFDEQEHTIGISAVGAGVRDRVGDVYAISIPAPSQRFEKKRDQLASELLNVVEKVRASM